MKKSKLPYDKLYKSGMLRVIIGITSFIFVLMMSELSASVLNLDMSNNVDDLFKNVLRFILSILIFQILILYLENKQAKLREIKSYEFRKIIYLEFLNQKISKINNIGLGGVKERLTRDIENTMSLVLDIVPSILIGIITGIGYLLYISFIDYRIAIILFLISFVQLIPPYVVKRYMEKNYSETARVGAEWMEYIIAGCKGLSTIKMNNLRGWYVKRLNKINDENVIAYRNTFKTASEEEALNNMISSILTYGSYVIVGIFVFKKHIQINSAVKLVVLCRSFYFVMSNMFSGLSRIFISKKAIERLTDFKNLEDYEKVQFEEFKNVIEFKNVSFSYENKKIFKCINFKIPKESLIAVVGENGAGKSTLTKLLLKIEEGYGGEIKYKNINIEKISEKQIYDEIVYIPQDDLEFTTSPENIFNMILKSKEADEVRLSQLLSRFNLTEDKLKANSFLELSGGERKKVSIISGLMRKANLFILDEPTNSLDSKSQMELIEVLLQERKSVLVISHDKNLIEKCDYKLNVSEYEVLLNEIGGERYA